MGKGWLLLILAMLLIMPGMAVSDDTDGFWNHLINKINKIVTSRPRGKTYTSVVGVRGAENDNDNSLYWKGEMTPDAGAEDVPPDEDAPEMFRAAVTFAMDGREADALRIFREFMATYPDSELIPDAAAAVAKLEAEMDGATVSPEPAASVAPDEPSGSVSVSPNASSSERVPEVPANAMDESALPVENVTGTDLPGS